MRYLTTLIVLATAWICFAGEEAPKETRKASGTKEPAAEKKVQPGQEKIDVWADHVVYEGQKNSFVFTGKVLVIQGDMKIDCDRMDGTLDPTDRSLERLIATGTVVKITTVDRRAEGTKADYDMKKNITILTGTPEKRPTLWTGKDMAIAEKITHYRLEDRFVLEGKVEMHTQGSNTPQGGGKSMEFLPPPKGE